MRAVFAVGFASMALKMLRGRDILISHAYIGTNFVPLEAVANLYNAADELWVDSGAFTYWQRSLAGKPNASITVEQWAAFLLGRDDYDWAVTLDVIGDANASFANWALLCALLGDRADRLVPVWHEGDPIEHLDAYNPSARLVALGRTEGRRPGVAGRKKTFQFYDEAFNRFPDGSYHLLGNSTAELIEPYPARSFDATSWERDSVYAQSHGWPGSRVSKETRMRAYIEAVCSIEHRPVPPEKQLSMFAEGRSL